MNIHFDMLNVSSTSLGVFAQKDDTSDTQEQQEYSKYYSANTRISPH